MALNFDLCLPDLLMIPRPLGPRLLFCTSPHKYHYDSSLYISDPALSPILIHLLDSLHSGRIFPRRRPRSRLHILLPHRHQRPSPHRTRRHNPDQPHHLEEQIALPKRGLDPRMARRNNGCPTPLERPRGSKSHRTRSRHGNRYLGNDIHQLKKQREEAPLHCLVHAHTAPLVKSLFIRNGCSPDTRAQWSSAR